LNAQGITGSQGTQGTAIQGTQGLQGTIQGVQGRQGTQGTQGRQGATSDIRLKKNIRPYEDGIQTIQGINPVMYQWNGLMGLRDEGVDNIGIIANELEKIMPNAIRRKTEQLLEGGPESELLYYDVAAVVFTLVNSSKQLFEEINDLKRRVKLLEDK
jgi:hypothetical protein